MFKIQNEKRTIMIDIGNFNSLKIVRKADFGFYLDADTGNTSDDILLPNSNTLSQVLNTGDEVSAFIYRDSKDRLIATLKKPLAVVGELAYLKVVSTTKIGSFVDFGLERDILVPFKEKNYDLTPGKKYLFYIYLDKTLRIAASTIIDNHLTTTDKYNIGDEVTATVYDFQTNRSVMVAIDNLFKGVILNTEYFNNIEYGESINLKVIKIYEDGRLGLTPRKSPMSERLSLQNEILEYLKNHDGFMTYNDKSSPEEIYSTFHESKNYFKNALGGLMKQGLITQDKSGTKLKQPD